MAMTNEERFSTPTLPHAERPIRLGSLLFTMVEARPGYEVAYNRWYERDHFYSGCLIGEYTLSGNRYIATKDCKAKRFGTVDRDLATGSFLALYWILEDHHKDWDNWAVKQVNVLHSEGRMFKERDHVHTGLYTYAGEYNGQGSSMPIELALDRPYGGVAVLVVDLAEGKSKADVDAFLKSKGVPGDVALLASPLEMDDTRPKDVPASAGNHVVFLDFTVEDPLESWDAKHVPLAKAIEGAGLGAIAFASPFKSVVFGTETYLDQL